TGVGAVGSNAGPAPHTNTPNPEMGSTNLQTAIPSAINTPAFSYGFDASPYSDLGIWENSPKTWGSQTPSASLAHGTQYVQSAVMTSEEVRFYTTSVQDEPYQGTEMSSPL